MSVLVANIFSSKFDCRPRPLYTGRPCMCMLYLLVVIYVACIIICMFYCSIYFNHSIYILVPHLPLYMYRHISLKKLHMPYVGMKCYKNEILKSSFLKALVLQTRASRAPAVKTS